MWAVVSASVSGTSHEATGLPCQDASQVMRARVGDEDVLLAAIADGAGSASHSQIGSSEAVQHLLKLVSQQALDLAGIGQKEVLGWYQEVLEHLKTVAERESVPIGELACTLLLIVVWKNGAVLGQIGDGAWVLEKDGALVAGTWPENGEYANVTTFLTSPNALGLTEQGALEHLQFQRATGRISGVAGFTDGIQALVLNNKDHAPHVPFFNTMLEPLRSGGDETELIAPLQQMLASEVVNSRTDDDKTLVLAVWREPEAEVKIMENHSAEASQVATGPTEVKPDGTAE